MNFTINVTPLSLTPIRFKHKFDLIIETDMLSHSDIKKPHHFIRLFGTTGTIEEWIRKEI